MPAIALVTDVPDLKDPALYLNRELSHLEFQRRVLEEARDARNPLLERVKFLSILGANIDEFFMVRVAGLMQQIENKVQEPGMDGRGPAETLEFIRIEVDRLMNEAYAFYREELAPELAAAGIRLLDLSEVEPGQRSQLDTLFLDKIFPVLTPLAFDQGRPFPHISNLSFNVAVVVRDHAGEHFARVKIPDSLPQFLPVNLMGENSPGRFAFVSIEQLVMANLQHLFPGLEIVEAHVFHVTRDADFAIKELETDDLLESIEEAVWQRRFRDAVRLQVDVNMPDSMVDILASNLEVEAASIYRVDGPLDLSRLRYLAALDRPDLKDKPFLPATPAGFGAKEDDVFGLIRQESQLLHHPYDSFQPVIEFLRKAAKDPDVVAIKMTLYRLGRNSPIVEALLEAVENGKQVAVLVELKARFDEESNIEWARALEREGVHVVYGLLGLKVHCKSRASAPQGKRCHPPVLPPGYGQLQSGYRAALHGSRVLYQRRSDRRGCHRPVQLSDRLFAEEDFSKVAGGSAEPKTAHGGVDPARDRCAAQWRAGPNDFQNECARGRSYYPPALSGLRPVWRRT